MQTHIFLATLLSLWVHTASGGRSSGAEVTADFSTWAKTYGKVYATPAEELEANKNFKVCSPAAQRDAEKAPGCASRCKRAHGPHCFRPRLHARLCSSTRI